MCNPSQHPDIELGGASSLPSPDEDFASTCSTQPLIKKRPHPQASTPSKARRDGDAMAPHADAGACAVLLDGLPPSQQMVLISFLMFLFFGMHNILQEAIVNLLSNSASIEEGSAMKSNGTLMLGYAEVIGVLLFSYLERVHLTKEGGWTRVAPLRAYPLLTLCLFASSSLSNLSLSYINFPTKVGE